MSAVVKLRLFARTFATQGNLVFRYASLPEADILTRRALFERWHIGPYDYHHFIAFYPKSYIIGEIDGEIAAHLGIIKFPQSHYHGAGLIVSDKYKHNRIGSHIVQYGMGTCDKSYTIGADVTLDSLDKYESFGFKKHWNTNIAILRLENISKSTLNTEQDEFIIQPLQKVNLAKLLQYDHSIFGTQRYFLLERWINTPGSFGWAAVDKGNNEITGYIILKQAIRGGGTEIGMAIAPLYADSAEIAKRLVQKAAKECIINPAIPKTQLEMVHPVGEDCGQGAAEIMKDLGAELVPICYRVYTKGVPSGRQTKKIYGIVSPSCD